MANVVGGYSTQQSNPQANFQPAPGGTGLYSPLGGATPAPTTGGVGGSQGSVAIGGSNLSGYSASGGSSAIPNAGDLVSADQKPSGSLSLPAQDSGVKPPTEYFGPNRALEMQNAELARQAAAGQQERMTEEQLYKAGYYPGASAKEGGVLFINPPAESMQSSERNLPLMSTNEGVRVGYQAKYAAPLTLERLPYDLSLKGTDVGFGNFGADLPVSMPVVPYYQPAGEVIASKLKPFVPAVLVNDFTLGAYKFAVDFGGLGELGLAAQRFGQGRKGESNVRLERAGIKSVMDVTAVTGFGELNAAAPILGKAAFFGTSALQTGAAYRERGVGGAVESLGGLAAMGVGFKGLQLAGSKLYSVRTIGEPTVKVGSKVLPVKGGVEGELVFQAKVYEPAVVKRGILAGFAEKIRLPERARVGVLGETKTPGAVRSMAVVVSEGQPSIGVKPIGFQSVGGKGLSVSSNVVEALKVNAVVMRPGGFTVINREPLFEVLQAGKGTVGKYAFSYRAGSNELASEVVKNYRFGSRFGLQVSEAGTKVIRLPVFKDVKVSDYTGQFSTRFGGLYSGRNKILLKLFGGKGVSNAPYSGKVITPLEFKESKFTLVREPAALQVPESITIQSKSLTQKTPFVKSAAPVFELPKSKDYSVENAKLSPKSTGGGGGTLVLSSTQEASLQKQAASLIKPRFKMPAETEYVAFPPGFKNTGLSLSRGYSPQSTRLNTSLNLSQSRSESLLSSVQGSSGLRVQSPLVMQGVGMRTELARGTRVIDSTDFGQALRTENVLRVSSATRTGQYTGFAFPQLQLPRIPQPLRPRSQSDEDASSNLRFGRGLKTPRMRFGSSGIKPVADYFSFTVSKLQTGRATAPKATPANIARFSKLVAGGKQFFPTEQLYKGQARYLIPKMKF